METIVLSLHVIQSWILNQTDAVAEFVVKKNIHWIESI